MWPNTVNNYRNYPTNQLPVFQDIDLRSAVSFKEVRVSIDVTEHLEKDLSRKTTTPRATLNSLSKTGDSTLKQVFSTVFAWSRCLMTKPCVWQ